jgi:prolyl oligopeptidase
MYKSFLTRSAVLALALASAVTRLAAADLALPTAPVKDVAETFFGTVVHDPYRSLESVEAADVSTWMHAHGDHARRQLDRIPGRKALFDKLMQIDSSVSARVVEVTRETDGRWFFERRGAADNQFKLIVRDGLAGTDRVLVDPEALEKASGKPHAINWFAPAPGGKLVAYGISQQGSEAAVLHLVDTASGQSVGPAISRADFGSVSWAGDAKSFVFVRLQEMKPGMAATDKYVNSMVWLSHPGESLDKATPVFGHGIAGVNIDPAEIPVVSLSHDGRWALGLVINGTQRELTLYSASAESLLAGKPQWSRLFDSQAQITAVAYMNDTLYLLSHQGAPRSQVLAVDLKRPELAKARLLVAQSERVITGIASAADALYIETRDGNVKRLFKLGHGEQGLVSEVALPVVGSFHLNDDNGSAADPRLPGLVVDLQGWTRARQVFQVGADGSVRNTGLQPQGPYDAPDDIVATEVRVPSHDGALVPMSILHRKGVALDGSHPTILYGYASYGITEEPLFTISRMAWLQAGGVMAIANPRGSSVYGEDWYRAGFQATKPNTWRDAIACAQWLIAQRWTSSAKLGIWGGSAGGILVGRAITERPDLFAAAVPAVGVLDLVRAEITANGVPNIPEFGSRSTEAGFRSLLAMSTYHQVKDGAKYPAVLFTAGANDPRVDVWHSTKTAARMMAATSSGKPILLRLDWDAGHGIGNTKAQQLGERADVFAFFLWQMGVAAYQPN